jgi:hypothetical protein
MSNQLRLIAAAVTTAVAALAMGQASAQNYGNSDYGHDNGYNGYGHGHSRSVRCESTNGRRAFCRVNAQGEVRIARQISHTACIEDRTWGSNDRGIWVSNGCRADFVIRSGRDYRHGDGGYGGNGYNNGNGDSRYVNSSGQVVQCDSTGDGRTYCHTETNHRYMLDRSRSGDCVEGQTWGTDSRGLWVSGDCRGDFNYQH